MPNLKSPEGWTQQPATIPYYLVSKGIAGMGGLIITPDIIAEQTITQPIETGRSLLRYNIENPEQIPMMAYGGKQATYGKQNPTIRAFESPRIEISEIGTTKGKGQTIATMEGESRIIQPWQKEYAEIIQKTPAYAVIEAKEVVAARGQKGGEIATGGHVQDEPGECEMRLGSAVEPMYF